MPDPLVPQVAIIEDVLAALGIAARRRGRLRGRRRDRHDRHALAPAGRHRHRRPGPLPAGRRRSAGPHPLHRAGRREARRVRRGLGAAKYGVPGPAYADFATLRGDPSDGLPGVPGVGEKTAAVPGDEVRVARRDPGRARRGRHRHAGGGTAKLAAARDYLEVAPVVVAVATDVPVPKLLDDARIPAKPHDPERLLELSERWGLDSSLNRVLTAFGAVTG